MSVVVCGLVPVLSVDIYDGVPRPDSSCFWFMCWYRLYLSIDVCVCVCVCVLCVRVCVCVVCVCVVCV